MEVLRVFVPHEADPAAVDEPPGRPPGVGARYVWRGAMPESARMHQGTVYPPCAGWILRESAGPGRGHDKGPAYQDGFPAAAEGS